MNIFVLSLNPWKAAEMHCDILVNKMAVEAMQMITCACIARGIPTASLPLSAAGKPLRGGYKHHPCSIWVQECWENFLWACNYGLALCQQFQLRFGKAHACEPKIQMLMDWAILSNAFPILGEMTPFVQAMDDEYRNDDPVQAYRDWFSSKTYHRWNRGVPAPDWYQPTPVAEV